MDVAPFQWGKRCGYPVDLRLLFLLSDKPWPKMGRPRNDCWIRFGNDDISTGWWFRTCFIFHFKDGMSSFPLTNSYFSRWLKPPTRYGIIVDIVDLTIKHCSNARIRWLKPPTSPDQDAKIRNAAERTPLMLGHPELEFYYGRGIFCPKCP